jgi:electron transport complex protein RnfB
MSDELSAETYRKLQEFLDMQPCGFPATESGLDIQNLRWMFTPEQAEVEVHMRAVPEPADVIAKRCGRPAAEVQEILESMVSDGLIMPVPGKGMDCYMAMQYMVGFGENQQSHRLTPERASMLVDYSEESGWLMDFTRQKQMRVIPIGESVDVPRAGVAPYNSIKEMISNQDPIAVSPCCCRMIKKNLGEVCDRPIDNELSYGFAAKYRIDNGFGRQLTRKEAFDIVDAADENAMVLSPVNAQEPTGMCACCSCCCYWLNGLKRLDRPIDAVQSSYQVSIDSDQCVECGTCLERCQMEALSENGGSIQVDLARCIGCGLCVTRCDEGALALKPRLGMGAPPKTYVGGLARIAADRGLPMGKSKRLVEGATLDSFARQWHFLHKVKLAEPILNFMEKRGML